MPAWCRQCAKCPRSKRSWGCRLSFSCGVACCAAGVPGAGGPGRCLISGRRVACCSWVCLLCALVGGGPPARSPHASFARSGRSRGPPWPCRRPRAPQPHSYCPAGHAVVSNRAGLVVCVPPWPAAVHQHRGRALRFLRCPPHQWGWVAVVWFGVSARSPAWPRHRPRVPRPGPSDLQCALARRAGILGRSAVCCYKRRQSEVFFVWISDPLLQTSSIRRLFR